MSTPLIDIAICWQFPNDTPETSLPRLREYGFEGIELWPDSMEDSGSALRLLTGVARTGDLADHLLDTGRMT